MPYRTALLAVLLLPAAVGAASPRPLEFHVTFDRRVSDQPFHGRLYVLLTRSASAQLPAGPNWFKPEPFFAIDLKGWKPGETAVVGAAALACPAPLPKLPKGTYSVHAVMDFDRGDRHFSTADGNGHSKPVRLELDPDATGPVRLTIDQVYRRRPFPEGDRVKLVEIESTLLSVFHGRPVTMRAAVALPKSYGKEPARRYPVVYEIPGFGGSHAGAIGAAAANRTDVAGVEMLWVVLDPGCRTGHHVFADSDNNGPWGAALTAELIPHVERTFRAVGTPAARFVTGHSSGGWSSLWLQVTYPDSFGGVWSTAPDPVDFRDFQRIDLYRPGNNMFTDEAGKPRPIARRGGKPVLWYRDFSDMEEVMGHGGQLGSFEAVFSRCGPDGQPRRLWDRRTGAIDLEVARSWERYDIRLVLERNWQELAPKLAGKLHVYMGGEDTFYLEGATARLKESLARLGSDAVVEIVPGKDHGTLMDRKMRERIAKEMAGQYCRHAQGNNRP
ncbi:MAG TPA: alpha/beta hydrolase-fold protein [Gemmataceae bacterium]|nr:alpha/beta hydrolase-fold protein [Gemmataceae bacterium]